MFGVKPFMRAVTSDIGPNMPIPTKPRVYKGMIAPRDSWMMPPPYNEMVPPGAPRLFGRASFFT
jgi:hypothetical protein